MPGLNKLKVGVNKDTQDLYILYLKKFDDLVENNKDNAFIEKVATLAGYRINQNNFSPDEAVTKEELILQLYTMGYFTEERVKQLLTQNNPQYGRVNEIQYVQAVDAVSFFVMVTGSRFEPSWGQENLTRRNLIVLLSELPKIKKQLNNYYEVKNTL